MQSTPRRAASAVGLAVLSALMLFAGACAGSAQPAPSAAQSSAPEETSPMPSQPPSSRSDATARLTAGVAGNDLAAVEQAISDGADLERRDRNGRTPLVAATKAGRVAIARALLEAGADPNAKDDLQDSAFLYAGAEGLDEILLLQAGADRTIPDGKGVLPRQLAADRGYDDIVALLDQ